MFYNYSYLLFIKDDDLLNKTLNLLNEYLIIIYILYDFILLIKNNYLIMLYIIFLLILFPFKFCIKSIKVWLRDAHVP